MGFILNMFLFVHSYLSQMIKLYYIVAKATLEKSHFRCATLMLVEVKNLKKSYKYQFYFSSVSACWVLFLIQHISETTLYINTVITEKGQAPEFLGCFEEHRN